MAKGKEESEWTRLSNLMAFIANRLRFSKDDPIVHPKDLNPFYESPISRQPKDIKDRMNEFWARNPNMPIQHMKLVDGVWVEVKVEG